MRLLARLVWLVLLVSVWPVYGLLLIPFYPIPFPDSMWYVSRSVMLFVAVVFAFVTAWLLNKVFEG